MPLGVKIGGIHFAIKLDVIIMNSADKLLKNSAIFNYIHTERNQVLRGVFCD